MKEYHINQQWKIDAFKKMCALMYWFVPIILGFIISDIEEKWGGVFFFSAIPLIMGVLFYVRQIVSPEYDNLTIEIDYQTGKIIRNKIEKFNVNDFGRIVCHKEGIKLFKKGFHSKMSYILNYSDLNTRSWNIFIPKYYRRL